VAESIHIPQSDDRETVYTALLPQIKSLIDGESNLIANAANMVAALKEAFGFFWIGCYFVLENELVLGPFQGPIACTRIQLGRGVCGTAWKNNETIVVPDVDLFPGHIACSSLSRSEIVVPIRDKKKTIIGVLDVDSKSLNDFSSIDKIYLEKICELLIEKKGE
jgi:L-methionine (R)-S-oxide reductase